jgi:hypothetical protein
MVFDVFSDHWDVGWFVELKSLVVLKHTRRLNAHTCVVESKYRRFSLKEHAFWQVLLRIGLQEDHGFIEK